MINKDPNTYALDQCYKPLQKKVILYTSIKYMVDNKKDILILKKKM
jgi:hypothetical protein